MLPSVRVTIFLTIVATLALNSLAMLLEMLHRVNHIKTHQMLYSRICFIFCGYIKWILGSVSKAFKNTLSHSSLRWFCSEYCVFLCLKTLYDNSTLHFLSLGFPVSAVCVYIAQTYRIIHYREYARRSCPQEIVG